MYYVYALIDIRSGLPFYIGKGKKENNRHADHFKENIGNTQNRHKFFKIAFLREAKLDIPVKILVDDILIEKDAYLLETSYITQYGRANIDPGGILTNICLNNQPPNSAGRKQSNEHIANRVKSYKETYKTRGRKPHSNEAKKKMSRPGKLNPFYGKTHSEEVKKKHSLKMKGNKNNSKRYIFTSPAGRDYIVVGEFYKFCQNNGLVIATMEKALRLNKMPIHGKCAGWTIKRI